MVHETSVDVRCLFAVFIVTVEDDIVKHLCAINAAFIRSHVVVARLHGVSMKTSTAFIVVEVVSFDGTVFDIVNGKFATVNIIHDD